MDRIKQISALDSLAMMQAKKKWNSIAKPLHSLGLLEEAVVKIAGMIGSDKVSLDKRCVVVMCSDNGVVAEGVTQTDSSVTKLVAESMAEGKANINLMAKVAQADVIVVDIGMNTDSHKSKIIKAKCSYGTHNLLKEKAMSREQALYSIEQGITQVACCKEMGYQVIVTGEMGIGNTTTTSAIASVILQEAPEEVTGKGAGLSKVGIERKVEVIKKAIQKHQPDGKDAIDLLSKIGGYDIAGMTGLFLGGAIYKVPIVIDGIISTVAAILATKICPGVKDYMLCSHVSKEPSGEKLLAHLGLKPLINAELCLGEGTGGILLLPLLDAALAVYNSSHQFEDLDITAYIEE